jgi:MFS transporter, CP family, cyanate transporter
VGQSLYFRILLLWLLGNALRLTILAVPPVIPEIHADLDMSATAVGVLGGLPVVMLALAALPGSLLIARFGPVRAVVVGLLLTAIGGALRGALPAVAWLYAMTILMGAGVAIMQPAMPALARSWTPHRVGFATAVYSNGLVIGEILPVVLMLPVVLPLVGGTWQRGLAFWSLPVAMIAVLVVLSSETYRKPGEPARENAPWWPNWKDGLIWRLGLTFGSVNAIYFSSNTFLPDYLASAGRSDLISGALSALNFGQLPASLLLLPLAGRLQGRAWPFAVAGLIALVSVVGVAMTSSAWTLAWASLIGFASTGVLVLVFALPPLLRPPAEVAPISAAMMTVSYTLAMLVAVASGAAWDLTGIPAAAFVPIGLCALLLLTVPATIRFERDKRQG